MKFVSGVCALMALAWTSAFAAPVPLDDPRWETAQAPNGAVEVAEFQGRQALFLRGAVARLNDANFDTGVIEFDMALPSTAQSFPGLRFRGVDDGNYEDFYFRPHQNGRPDTLQYTPVINGMTGWQIYSQYNAQKDLPINRWFRVRVEVAEDSARMFVDGASEPTLVVGDLKRDRAAGWVMLRGSLGGAYYANLNITPGAVAAAPPEAARELPAGLVRTWRVSAAIAEADAFVAAQGNRLNSIAWTPLEVETNGFANLARVAVTSPETLASMARLSVRSDRTRTVAMRFAFSDRVRLYVNGALIYSGDDTQSTRDYRFLGTLGWYDTLQLPLRRGVNEIVFVVSEGGNGNVGGGWAAGAAFPDMTGLAVQP